MIEALLFVAGIAVGALAYHYGKKPQAEAKAQTKGAGGPGPIDPTRLQ